MRQLLRDILLLACGAALGAVGFWQWQQGPIYTSGEAEVIDGDNLKIDGTNWRLAGLDAPELPIINGKECRKHNPPTGCVNASSLNSCPNRKGACRHLLARRIRLAQSALGWHLQGKRY